MVECATCVSRGGMSDDAKKKKKKINYSEAWVEAQAIVWRNRHRLALGIGLMLVSRAAGFVLPLSLKPIVDGVFLEKDTTILPWIVAAVAVATVVQAITAFSLSQVLGVAAQRAIMELRKEVQYHVTRLPTSYFDSTKYGVLISRVMTDPEGIRNLVGTGLSQLAGGLLTAVAGLIYLFYKNWHIT